MGLSTSAAGIVVVGVVAVTVTWAGTFLGPGLSILDKFITYCCYKDLKKERSVGYLFSGLEYEDEGVTRASPAI